MIKWKIIGRPSIQEYFMKHKELYSKTLSNKQSARVICRFDRLRTAHRKRLENLLTIHAFNNVMLGVNLL